MAVSTGAKTSPLTDIQKSDKYQQAISLNLDCGSDTLRKLIETKLDNNSTTLRKHLLDPAVQKNLSKLNKKMFKEQVHLLNRKNPDLFSMDISLLTLVLLDLFSLDKAQEDAVKRLRECRNMLAHRARSQLEDDQFFNKVSLLLIGLSKDTTPEFEKEIRQEIKELKERKLVRTHSMLDIVKLLNESFMVKLMDAGSVDKVDPTHEIWIKYCLTKFVRHLARSIDIDIFLQNLKEEGVVSASEKRSIQRIHDAERQFQQLVVFMVDQTRENHLKFCDVMRNINPDIAEFVIHNDGSRDIGTLLKECEKEKVIAILESSLVVDKKENVACEDVHILVNERRKCFTKFETVLDCMKELFPTVNSSDKDKFCGIAWCEDVHDFEDLAIPEAKEEILTEMPCDRFSKYLAVEMAKVKSSIGPHIEAIIDEHSIDSTLFARFKPEEIETYFKPGLEIAGIKYNIGIKEGLLRTQKQINMQINRSAESMTDCLRKFDKPVNLVKYAKCDVRPTSGNLLTAAHEFVQPVLKQNTNICFTYISKQIVRFAMACINGKQNGTIHFGIEEIGNGGGRIVGLPADAFSDTDSLNDLLTQCLKRCLDKEYIPAAQRCIRPIQIIPVEDNFVVLEVDVVPYAFYAKEDVIRIQFPPNGYQKTKVYIYVNNKIISVLEKTKEDIDYVANTIKELHMERKQIEDEEVTTDDKISLDLKQIKRLEKLLLRGNVYVTDYFYPIICCGEISDSENEETVREQISAMSTAFISAEGVFDFDSSVELRELIEKGEDQFAVKTPDEFKGNRYRRESGSSKERIWMYANGNSDIPQQKLKGKHWIGQRYKGVRNAIENISRNIPEDRGLVIFLVFQKTLGKDIMLELARDCFIDTFTDGCIVIAEKDTAVQDWKDELSELMDKKELEKYFVVGLSWNDVCCVMKRVFKPNKDDDYHFPNKKGNVIEMTIKEKKELEFQTIDIIDGKMYEKYCQEEEDMLDEDRRERRQSEEKRFYRGENVSFWNFYYEGQVGPRNDYGRHRSEIKMLLTSHKEDFYETYTIEHHPGAGGTTLGRHLLWSFSQIRTNPEQTYRCCIVNTVSATTAEEIYRFLYFKEDKESKPKPVIVLLDNVHEEGISMLKANIDSVVYRYGGTDMLFCLLLLVNRVPVSTTKRDKILTHSLTTKERDWFESKFLDLENRGEDVNTLLAFNVMRHSFDSQYVKDLTNQLMKEINDKEISLLESLSLVTFFDRDHSVPESVFDSFMHDKKPGSNEMSLADLENKGPVGLVVLKGMRRQPKDFQDTWNVKMSNSLKLLIKRHKVDSENCHYTGINIISHTLADAILQYIMEFKKRGIETIIYSLLGLAEQHKDAKDPMSVQFIKLVCSLFKTRQTQEGDKLEFSDLVLHLEKPVNEENDKDAHGRVISVMEKCFNITKDPMVGQQLARFFIHIRDFDKAEGAIKRSLDLRPQSSYLLDTYGQVFRKQILYLLEGRSTGEMKDVEAATAVQLAFSAVEKFREAQEMTGSLDEDNTGCFNMEVNTILMLLENFHKFQCFVDMRNFRRFLADETFDVKSSSFRTLYELEPKLENLREGRESQQHAHISLKKLEESDYMIKDHVTLVTTTIKTSVLMKTRDRFLRYYGSEDEVRLEFWFGLGLKQLMEAYKRERRKFKDRFRVAERNLQSNIPRGIEADLLIYLGYRIIEISAFTFECSADEYKLLTNYSSRLCIQQMRETNPSPYIEGFLYYVMLHWPLQARLDDSLGLEGLQNPDALESIILRWEKAFKKNHDKPQDQLQVSRPKTYFALGFGLPGNDLVDYDKLRMLWRKEKKNEGRERKHVKADNSFHHRIFEERLVRLYGVVETGGNKIRHRVEYRGKRTHIFHIHTYENCSHLKNKAVTFVLGFSWMGPIAMDVRRTDKMSRQISTGRQRSVQNTHNTLDEEATSESQGISLPAMSVPMETLDKMPRDSSSGRQRSVQNTHNTLDEKASLENQGISLPAKSVPMETLDKMFRPSPAGRQRSVQNTRNTLDEEATMENQGISFPAMSVPIETLGNSNQGEVVEGAVGGMNDTLTTSSSGDISPVLVGTKDKTKLPAEATVVTTEEESRHIIDSLLSSATIACVTGGKKKKIRIFIIHMPPKTYIYYIDNDLVSKWHLDELLMNKDINIVFHNIRKVSVSLMTEYDILIDGNIWDIQMMLDKCSFDSVDIERLTESGFSHETVKTWSTKDIEYGSKLLEGDVDRSVGFDLSARAKLIWKLYETCKGQLDTHGRSAKLYSDLKTEIFAAAHPSSMEDTVKRLKKRQKKKRQKLNRLKDQDGNQKEEDCKE